MLKDSHHREQATDPKRSFIVQAPAGSGKTEILTQRFLRLLSQVNVPEHIVALTFTRKAASEMRERVVLALQNVANGVRAESAHQRQTYAYAHDVLNHAIAHDWQLLEQPSRLRIMTIDALCQTLTHAIPLQDQQIPSYAKISDDPLVHYQAAARACLAHAIEDQTLQPSLKCLLVHLDNRQDKLLELLSDLLATRDQWLSSLYSAREQKKVIFEQMLAFIEHHELSRFKQTIPLTCRHELCALSRQIACIEANPKSPRYPLQDWQTFDALNRQITSGLASLLLTSDNKLRKRWDHHVGLKQGSCDGTLYQYIKTTSEALLNQLAESPGFLDALLKVKHLPAPHYDAEQWQVLQALFSLLPILVAHLHLIFNENNEVDFNAVAQQALMALGTEEQPTDLTLYLDNTIHHLLVDEFQDTSMQQFQLLTQLVQGWQPDEGKTLFIVGDPMQSIYRFRQAEVGLFLKAKQEGIGPIPLTKLELCCNFRSTETLVTWVNQQFQTIFPPNDDIESGAISFHSSTHILKANHESEIKAWQFSNCIEEAHAIVQRVKEELHAYPNAQIAILVRSRTQLTTIIPLLREQNLPFQGVDIELLSQLPHLRDLWSLTQALLMPAHRLAWLALLRSPLAGLSLKDLHLIANFDKKKSIYYALSHWESITNLSSDGRLRARFVYSVLHDALARRHQQSLVDWVVQTLKQLQGDIILTTAQQADLEQFWMLLDQLNQTEPFLDLTQFKIKFNQLYSQRATPSRLQIMTIHKSKGLEFDCVMLPGLSTKTRNKKYPLLRWLKLPRYKHGELILVSPLKAAYREHCLVYDYLTQLDEEKELYERQRLLYVAVTRAKKRLYLFDSREKEMKGTFRSFLTHQEFLTPDKELVNDSTEQALPSLYRLPSDYYLHPLPLTQFQRAKVALLPGDDTARLIGIVAHELLQWICDKHPSTTEELPWSLVMRQFKRFGFSEHEQTQAYETLRQQIDGLFNHSIGQWLIKPHRAERNEYELLVYEEDITKTYIIDRTFIDQDIRWIIDFKTGREYEEATHHHQQQINYYAKLIACKAPEPIRCGLYYLASGHWVTWPYQEQSSDNIILTTNDGLIS